MDGINNDIVNLARSLELAKKAETPKNKLSSEKHVKNDVEVDNYNNKELQNNVKISENEDISNKKQPEIKQVKEKDYSKLEKNNSDSSNLNIQDQIKNQDDSKKSDALESKQGKTILSDGTVLYFRLEETKNEETGAVSKELFVYLVDKESGDILRRIPPEEFNERYSKKINEVAGQGVFINQIG